MAKLHLIGIKGAGMSALAQILHDLGRDVQGSDTEESYFTEAPLRLRSIPVLPFDAANIRKGMQVVASNAFGDDHVEIRACREKGISVLRYHQYLGEMIGQYRSIAVTGSHGKTTTTGMLAHVLQGVSSASCLIGDGTGMGRPGSQYFVFESCEYRRHYLAYRPDHAIITNIDFDHPDYFRDIDDVRSAFEEMAGQVAGTIVACGDDVQVQRLRTVRPMLLYGFAEHNSLRASRVRYGNNGTTFAADWRGVELGLFFIPSHGKHQVLNALAVIGFCLSEDLNLDAVREKLATFSGVKRRFAEKSVAGNVVIDDYAHHPAEIKAAIEAVRAKYPGKRLVSVFQPHTYSRLAKFLDHFAEALLASDDVFLCGIFGSARESRGAVTIGHLMERIPGSRLLTEHSVEQLQAYDQSVMLFMGAGDIQKYERLYESSQKKGP